MVLISITTKEIAKFTQIITLKAQLAQVTTTLHFVKTS
jgi:hypothetical protein